MALWAAERPPLVLIHDDIAMQQGMVFHPRWYRQRLFPLYERFLEPLLADPAIRVCFVSDGDYSAVLPDLVALGFHGFLINPNMDLAAIARAYGRDHFLVGNVDTAVLTFGSPEDAPARGGALRRGGQALCRAFYQGHGRSAPQHSSSQPARLCGGDPCETLR